MIAHVSIPARRPEATARVFAEIMDAVIMPFPPVPGGWMVICKDGSGVGLEILPETTAIICGEEAGEASVFGYCSAPVRRDGAIHVALTSKLSVDEVISLGRAMDWRAVHCDRGAFDLVELWVDNRLMIEVLAPEGTTRYLAAANAA
ncbi:MAG: hypothetical protein KA105_08205 [Caulobacter sp.]|nr:hypothetical protein [Caulobacter sp.]